LRSNLSFVALGVRVLSSRSHTFFVVKDVCNMDVDMRRNLGIELSGKGFKVWGVMGWEYISRTNIGIELSGIGGRGYVKSHLFGLVFT
jgi:hypothetical protein